MAYLHLLGIRRTNEYDRIEPDRRGVAVFARRWRAFGSKVRPLHPGRTWYDVESKDYGREWLWVLSEEKEMSWPRPESDD